MELMLSKQLLSIFVFGSDFENSPQLARSFFLSDVLIKSFTTNPKLLRQLCPVCSGCGLLSQLRNSLCIECRLPALVGSLGLCQGYSFPLSLLDERALKLRECAQHGKHQDGTRVITTSGGKVHILFNELNRYALVIHFPDKPEHVLDVTRQPVHGMDYERI